MPDETPLIFGDAVTAELERPSRRRRWFRRKKAPPIPLTHCENCGTALAGPYCAQCGQPAIDYRRSLGSLLLDAADAFFNFDARFFQSFGWLLVKPWRLTNEFIEGKRARHVHPLRVYLIASVTFFLVINFLAKGAHMHAEAKPGRKKGQFFSVNVDDEGKSVAPPPSPSPGIAFSFSSTPPAETERNTFSLLRPGVAEPLAKPSRSDDENVWNEIENQKDMPAFARWIERRAKDKLGTNGDRGDLFLKALIQNIAPMVLCCIPLFALVLKILYVFKRRYYIDHLIFALHTHAFIFLSTVVIIGVGFLLEWKTPGALTPLTCTFLAFVVVAQLLIAIRRVYRQNWFATFFKFFLGSVIYATMLGIAFGVTAFVTLLLP